MVAAYILPVLVGLLVGVFGSLLAGYTGWSVLGIGYLTSLCFFVLMAVIIGIRSKQGYIDKRQWTV